MAKKEKSEKNKKGKKKGSTKTTLLLTLGSLAMIIAMQMTYVLFVIGMLPTFVAYFIDRTPSRSIYHTVMPCNLSGVLPFVVDIISRDNSNGALQAMLSDFSVLLIMYASAGLGWVLVYASPYVAAWAIGALNGQQISKLKKAQTSILREWGEEVAHAPGE